MLSLEEEEEAELSLFENVRLEGAVERAAKVCVLLSLWLVEFKTSEIALHSRRVLLVLSTEWLWLSGTAGNGSLHRLLVAASWILQNEPKERVLSLI